MLMGPGPLVACVISPPPLPRSVRLLTFTADPKRHLIPLPRLSQLRPTCYSGTPHTHAMTQCCALQVPHFRSKPGLWGLPGPGPGAPPLSERVLGLCKQPT